jgi:predicted aldo/keto reductase-like oxidoreductase
MYGLYYNLPVINLKQKESGMNKRRLGMTGLMVSEIGFGGEWLERHSEEESIQLIKYASSQGINILDCWMSDPKSRNIIGEAIKQNRSEWFIQGHIGSTWKDGQYHKTRDMAYVRPAFEDLLERLQTDYIDLGMIHFVDSEDEWDQMLSSDYMDFVKALKRSGDIRHIGMSSHNPKVAIKAAQSGFVEMILFSINPAFDMLPASEDINALFAEEFDSSLKGIDPDRALLYKICEERDVGITVMKAFAGGRLFDEKRSPFGVRLSVSQCIHYALTRPAVSAVICGFDTMEQVDEAVKYETASEVEKDYASVIASAPLHSYRGQCTYCGHCKPCPIDIDIAMVNKYYDLATMQPEVPATIKSHYELLGHHASECISCDECSSRCPFGVEVSDRMKKTSELFGV